MQVWIGKHRLETKFTVKTNGEYGVMWKLLILWFRRILRAIFRNATLKLSIVFLCFSASVSLMILVPNFFDRAPIYSHLVRELNLPISYEVFGQVQIVGLDDDTDNRQVEIFVGGYHVSANIDGTFSLRFSSPLTNEIFLIIRHTTSCGKTTIVYEVISPRLGEHRLEREFVIYVSHI